MVAHADEIVALLVNLTAKSQSCQGPANQISVVNIAFAVSGFGPVPIVIARFTEIITILGSGIASIAGTKPFSIKSDEDAIVTALITFVQVHEALLQILIGKVGLVPALVPIVGPPIAAVLRNLESVVDTVAFELISLLPTSCGEAEKQKVTIDKTLNDCIGAWSPSGLGI